MTAPDRAAVEAAIRYADNMLRFAMPSMDRYAYETLVAVARAYLDAQKAERRPVAHCVHCGQTHERCPDAACVREGISMKALDTPTFNHSPKDPT
jgi:hypothetical protein